ncbi:MAG: methyltransferase [Firmicutes bacterium]|nr:methyltransferase [Bacillota bacterium]
MDVNFLLPGERIDDLGLGGLGIIQGPRAFGFGTDAVLLADFARIRTGEKVLDLCTGCGIVPILLCGKTGAGHVTGLEIQDACADMARRSVMMNGLEGRIDIAAGDAGNAPELFGAASFDVVTVNPPYIKNGAGLQSADGPRAVARHEILCSLEEIIAVSARMLKPMKRFYMVHRPERLADIICLMRGYGLEPKTLRFACDRPGLPPVLVLAEGVKGGKAGMRVLAEVYCGGG